MERPEAQAFYEVEAVNSRWSTRELERQIHSLLFERLALSRDREGVLALAEKGHEIQQPGNLIKDPYVLEFAGLPQSGRCLESDLEQALIDKLREFLLELGKGFAFMARQQRITLDGQHFWIDLVFYNRLTRSFVLIDLKVGSLAHQDLGQMQMYVNYYQRESPPPTRIRPLASCSVQTRARPWCDTHCPRITSRFSPLVTSSTCPPNPNWPPSCSASGRPSKWRIACGKGWASEYVSARSRWAWAARMTFPPYPPQFINGSFTSAGLPSADPGTTILANSCVSSRPLSSMARRVNFSCFVPQPSQIAA